MIGEGAGFFMVALGLAADGGVAATPGGATATNLRASQIWTPMLSPQIPWRM